MSMTVQQRPDTNFVHGAFEPLMYVLTSTDQASGSNYKFRYIADLYVAGIRVSRVKVYPNTSGAGIIRVDKLIQDWMSVTKADQGTQTNEFYDTTIHKVGSNTTSKIWSHSNGENYRKVEMRFGEEFSTSNETDPTVFLNLIVGEFIDCVMSGGLRRPDTWDEGIPNFLDSEDWLKAYIPTSSAKQVLSDREIDDTFTSTTASTVKVVHQDATTYEVRTLGVPMDNATPVKSLAVSAWIGLYDSSDVLLDSGFMTAATSGGTAPAAVTTDDARLQYIGVGPWNLTTQQVIPSFDGHFLAFDVAYYEVFFMQDSVTVPSNATTGDMASLCYQYTVVESDCTYGEFLYNYVTLAWQNSFGAWDYQSFSLRHQRTTGKIKRSSFQQVEGNWNTADAAQDFNFRGDEAGTRISSVMATQELIANTDLFNEKEVALLETLYLSPNVFLIGAAGATITPIVVMETKFVRKTNLNERGPFTYQVRFKYAKDRPTTKGGTYRGYS